ncbi:hypothetical protein G6F62_012795 [Rhizopus arrhizus]|nr:hypothetical protein G6F35_012153 [Rhizopus arrhizus]KAG1317602.1 hypothetical protein G6F62_012795 [Rhizopus arrhizus]
MYLTSTGVEVTDCCAIPVIHTRPWAPSAGSTPPVPPVPAAPSVQREWAAAVARGGRSAARRRPASAGHWTAPAAVPAAAPHGRCWP